MRRSLKHPLALAAMCGACWLSRRTCRYRALGSDLLPAFDEGGFVLDYVMPPGSSLQETNRVLRHVEAILRDDAGSREHVAPDRPRARTRGGHRAEHRRHCREAESEAQPQRRRGDQRRAREGRRSEPGLDVEFIQVLQDMIGDLTGAPEPVVVKLFSPDPDLLSTLGAAGRRGAREGDDRRQDADRRRRGRHREHDERTGGALHT